MINIFRRRDNKDIVYITYIVCVCVCVVREPTLVIGSLSVAKVVGTPPSAYHLNNKSANCRRGDCGDGRAEGVGIFGPLIMRQNWPAGEGNEGLEIIRLHISELVIYVYGGIAKAVRVLCNFKNASLAKRVRYYLIVAAISAGPLTPVVVVHAVGLGSTPEGVYRVKRRKRVCVCVCIAFVVLLPTTWSGNAPVLRAIMNAAIRTRGRR